MRVHSLEPGGRFGEEGTALILALVFLVAMSLILAALVSLSGDGLAATAQLKDGRALEYAGDGATDAAIEAVRYSDDSYTGGSPQLCTLGPNQGSLTIDGYQVYVFCQAGNGVSNSGTLAWDRDVVFYACLDGSDNNQDCLDPTSGQQILEAEVGFDDFTSRGQIQCDQTTQLSCGAGGLEIVSWKVATANNA